MLRTARTLDVVTLTHPAGGWPAGAVGTVVEEDPESGRALVEVVNESRLSGRAPSSEFLDDLIEVPQSHLQIVAREPAPRAP